MTPEEQKRYEDALDEWLLDLDFNLKNKIRDFVTAIQGEDIRSTWQGLYDKAYRTNKEEPIEDS